MTDIRSDKQELITLGDDTPYNWGQFVWTLTRVGQTYHPTLKKTASAYWCVKPDGSRSVPLIRLAVTGEGESAMDCYATKKAAQAEANYLNGVKR